MAQMSDQMENVEIDKNSLYREESYTDMRAGTIRKMVPVQSDGSDDPDRDPIYSGQVQIMGPTGPLPVETRIEAESLEDAVDKFPSSIKLAVDQLISEVERYQQENSSRIVTPGSGGGQLGGLGGGGQSGNFQIM